jgi:hypothetical protein
MCRLQFSETASFWKEVKVASEIRVIQAAMAPAVRGVISHLSEAKVGIFPLPFLGVFCCLSM